MELEAVERGSDRREWGKILGRVESVYLGILRAATIIIATGFLLYFAWLLTSGTYKLSRNVDSVHEAPSVVGADEIVAAEVEGEPRTATKAIDPVKAERAFYGEFVKGYYKLFSSRFQSYKKSDDTALAPADFDAAFLQVDRRLEAIKSGDLDFEEDKRRLQSLLAVMSKAANLPKTVERLKAYKKSKKISVSKKINRTRTEQYCSYYGYYIDACIEWDTREVPYVETVTSLQLPKGVVPYSALFGSYQAAYLTKLNERTEASKRKAEDQRSEIMAANADGRSRLWTGMQVAAAFLVLMFFFLLIAMERHQRSLAKIGQ